MPIHRCTACSIVIDPANLRLLEGKPYHAKCAKAAEFSTDPTIVQLHAVRRWINYAAGMDPADIVRNAKMKAAVVEMHRRLKPLFKTI